MSAMDPTSRFVPCPMHFMHLHTTFLTDFILKNLIQHSRRDPGKLQVRKMFIFNLFCKWIFCRFFRALPGLGYGHYMKAPEPNKASYTDTDYNNGKKLTSN